MVALKKKIIVLLIIVVIFFIVNYKKEDKEISAISYVENTEENNYHTIFYNIHVDDLENEFRNKEDTLVEFIINFKKQQHCSLQHCFL